MNLLLTQGLGSMGDGSPSALLTTAGLGGAGAPNPPACLALQALAAQSYGGYIDVIFSAVLAPLDGPALLTSSYVITGPSVIQVLSLEVLPVGHIIRLYVTDQLTAQPYVLTLPQQGIMDINGNVLNNYTVNFNGLNIPTMVQIVKSVDERTLDIVFNEAVFEEDASNPANYSISPTLAVTKAVRLTDFNYRLTTGPQTIGATYNVTVSGLRDIHGNI